MDSPKDLLISAVAAAIGLLVQQARIYLMKRRAAIDKEKRSKTDVGAFVARLDWLTSKVQDIHAELSYNSGKSVKDMLRATAERLDSLEDRVADAASISSVRWRVTANTSPTGIFECDRNGECTFANLALQSMFGQPESGMLGNGWLESVGRNPDERSKIWDQWAHSVNTGIPWDATFWVNRKGHSPIQVHSAARIKTADNGKTKIICGTVTPLVDQRFIDGSHPGLKMKDSG